MANLKTTYMGIGLKNPIIVGACNLVTDLNNLKKIEEAGAAAIVYKSLFEEQIQLEDLEMHETITEYANRNAEMTSLFPVINHAGPAEYLMNLEKAKKSVSIPVFASLNAIYKETWVEYAVKIQETGVDGIELNFYHVPDDFEASAQSIEEKQIDILKSVKAAVKIPVSVKLSPFYSNPLKLIAEMDKAGANAFVLFNRLFQPDIDLKSEEHHFPYSLSNEDDNRLALRYSGLLYKNINASICANTGIYSGNDVAKMILAGADCVQVVSTLYKNRIDVIATMLNDLESWMNSKGYKTLDDFRGGQSKKRTKDHYAYKRAQYVDILMHSNEIFKKYPMR
jgi:dihydroorotate dehydrogenase (fumarate)